ncbi:hypothetical protein HDU97_003984 [Phlyctochytrium planicorne]|nr:hypothetical protein HDU97_003984 [Phlyctochytrium planicorne]
MKTPSRDSVGCDDSPKATYSAEEFSGKWSDPKHSNSILMIRPIMRIFGAFTGLIKLESELNSNYRCNIKVNQKANVDSGDKHAAESNFCSRVSNILAIKSVLASFPSANPNLLQDLDSNYSDKVPPRSAEKQRPRTSGRPSVSSRSSSKESLEGLESIQTNRIPVTGRSYGLKLPRMASRSAKSRSVPATSDSKSAFTQVGTPQFQVQNSSPSVESIIRRQQAQKSSSSSSVLPNQSGYNPQDFGNRFILALLALLNIQLKGGLPLSKSLFCNDAQNEEILDFEFDKAQYETLILSECMTVLNMYRRLASSNQLVMLKGPSVEVAAALHLLTYLITAHNAPKCAKDKSDVFAGSDPKFFFGTIPFQLLIEVVDPSGKGYLRTIVNSKCPSYLQKAYVRLISTLLSALPTDSTLAKSVCASASIALRWISGDVLEAALMLMSPRLREHTVLCTPFVRGLVGIDRRRRKSLLGIQSDTTTKMCLPGQVLAFVAKRYGILKFGETASELFWDMELMSGESLPMLPVSWSSLGIGMGISNLFHISGFKTMPVAYLEVLLCLLAEMVMVYPDSTESSKKEKTSDRLKFPSNPDLKVKAATKEGLGRSRIIASAKGRKASKEPKEFWINLFFAISEGLFASLTSEETSELACNVLEGFCILRGKYIFSCLPKLSSVLATLHIHGAISRRARERFLRWGMKWSSSWRSLTEPKPIESKTYNEDIKWIMKPSNDTIFYVNRGLEQALATFRASVPLDLQR